MVSNEKQPSPKKQTSSPISPWLASCGHVADMIGLKLGSIPPGGKFGEALGIQILKWFVVLLDCLFTEG